jgi:hypothetical protein
MTPQQKGIYRLMFKSQLSTLTGMAFQNFFSEIMQYSNPNFSPVKPQGNEGDWKNDGYDPISATYYQVYSPEQLSESEAIKKLQTDFSGLHSQWGGTAVYSNGVNKFQFVINDHYRVTPGGYPTTIAALENLKKTYSLVECKLFLAKHLEDILLSLEEDKIISVLYFPPNPADIGVLPLPLVDEVIKHIVEHGSPRPLNQKLVDPDFDKKIIFNRLDATSHLLRDANYRQGSLEDYFVSNSDFVRQEVRNRLNDIYEDSRTLGFQDEDGITSSDQQLFNILEKVTPNIPNKDNRLKKEMQDAALVVMAYFFESCDIFEEPI